MGHPATSPILQLFRLALLAGQAKNWKSCPSRFDSCAVPLRGSAALRWEFLPSLAGRTRGLTPRAVLPQR